MKRTAYFLLMATPFAAGFMGCGDSRECVPVQNEYCLDDFLYQIDNCKNEPKLLSQCPCGCSADKTACQDPCQVLCNPPCDERTQECNQGTCRCRSSSFMCVESPLLCCAPDLERCDFDSSRCCVLNDSIQCVQEGDVSSLYAVDSCGMRGEKKEQCVYGCSQDFLNCGWYDAELVYQNIADDTAFSPGQLFAASWTFANTGNIPWEEGKGFSFRRIQNDKLCPDPTLMSSYFEIAFAGIPVLFQETKTWLLEMTAPEVVGVHYRECWQMYFNEKPFGEEVYIDIQVSSTCKGGYESCAIDSECCSTECCSCPCGDVCKATSCVKDCILC